MSVSKWAYVPEYCDGNFCVGDCDLCDEWQKFEDTDEESEGEDEQEYNDRWQTERSE